MAEMGSILKESQKEEIKNTVLDLYFDVIIFLNMHDKLDRKLYHLFRKWRMALADSD